MKFSLLAAGGLATLAFLSSTSAHMAMSYPPGGYGKGPVTELRAGKTIDVRFWTFGVKDYKQFPPQLPGGDQARHGGGYCEFSLSIDAGKTWRVIGQYTRTCPDLFYEWPVLIPANTPSCSDSNKCLFSFSWVAHTVNQFYHHCANVVIRGVKNGKLPPLKMTVVDVKPPRRINAEGDSNKGKGKGSGPDPREVRLNKQGFFAYGGGAGNKGLDLRLMGPKRR
ncbi:hypothetical protein BGZ72_009297 [Mortierella alpina]|nr:hypothetical protein BGZ72_009297 [Mortierella alpina]